MRYLVFLVVALLIGGGCSSDNGTNNGDVCTSSSRGENDNQEIK